MTVPNLTSASTVVKKVIPPLTVPNRRSAGSAGNRYDALLAAPIYSAFLMFILVRVM